MLLHSECAIHLISFGSLRGRPETRVTVKIFDLWSEGNVSSEEGARERKRVSEGCTVKSFTTAPDWSLVLWRNSGKWYKTHTSE